MSVVGPDLPAAPSAKVSDLEKVGMWETVGTPVLKMGLIPQRSCRAAKAADRLGRCKGILGPAFGRGPEFGWLWATTAEFLSTPENRYICMCHGSAPPMV